jgi:hypothetical protein
MKLRRYQNSASVHIAAPIEQVYALASDPAVVPSYAREIDRIEIVELLNEHQVLVKSYLKLVGLTFGFLYRYHYRRPLHYGGVQERSGPLRGYFSLTFRPGEGCGTTVSHIEGIFSRVPLLARIGGFVYFRVLARGGMTEELDRLKHLIENHRDGQNSRSSHARL